MLIRVLWLKLQLKLGWITPVAIDPAADKVWYAWPGKPAQEISLSRTKRAYLEQLRRSK